jgi:hypothetical protein
MVNYSNTVFYKLRHKDNNITDFFLGMATNFAKTKSDNKAHCNQKNESGEYTNHRNIYNYIRENGGYDEFTYDILERANLATKEEADTKLKFYINTLKPTLNTSKYIDPNATPHKQDDFNLYTIQTKDGKFRYVGRTKDYDRQINQHKKDAITSNNKLNTTIRNYNGWDNMVVKLVDVYENKTLIEVKHLQEQFRLDNDCNLNERCIISTANDLRKMAALRSEKHKAKLLKQTLNVVA